MEMVSLSWDEWRRLNQDNATLLRAQFAAWSGGLAVQSGGCAIQILVRFWFADFWFANSNAPWWGESPIFPLKRHFPNISIFITKTMHFAHI